MQRPRAVLESDSRTALYSLRRQATADPPAAVAWRRLEPRAKSPPSPPPRRLRLGLSEPFFLVVDPLFAMSRPCEEGVHYRQPQLPRGTPALPKRLTDIVSICTQCHRLGRGNLIWLTWQAAEGLSKPASASRIQFGSTGIAITRGGARMLQSAFESGDFPARSGHWDCDLKTWLVRRQADVGGGYIYPPLGHFAPHPSGCDERYKKERPASWGTSWVCPGTSRSEDPANRQKWLCGWTANARTAWLSPLQDDASDIRWRSFWALEGPMPLWRARAAGEEEVDPSQHRASASATPSPASREPSARGAGDGPDAAASSSGGGGDEARLSPPRQRRRRMARQHLTHAAKRCWVETEGEARPFRGKN
jgi:hypothetical protein